MKAQTGIIDNNISVFNKLSQENHFYSVTTGIASGLMLTAMGFAIAEVVQCATTLGATGCVNSPKPKKDGR